MRSRGKCTHLVLLPNHPHSCEERGLVVTGNASSIQIPIHEGGIFGPMIPP